MKTTTIAACKKCNGNCFGCLYAFDCNIYNDVAPYVPYQIVTYCEVSMSLCRGTHCIPEAVDGNIFDTDINPLAVDELEKSAMRTLTKMSVTHLNLYVTGLTVALVAVINACKRLNISLVLYHYDRETEEYYPQKVK